MVEIGIRFRWRTNFDDKLSTIFELDTMRAPDTRAVEQIAAETAAKMNSAKLIHCLYNPLGAVGGKAVQFDERRVPGLNFVPKCLDRIERSSSCYKVQLLLGHQFRETKTLGVKPAGIICFVRVPAKRFHCFPVPAFKCLLQFVIER
jgi:hypothetical protein